MADSGTKYYLIAGEASGDLHASHLIRALRDIDPQAQFRCFGGDLMEQQGAHLVCHYRHLAYMGIIPVLLHARTILRGMRQCREDILRWQPDALILVDYPGFNLKMARFIHSHTQIPVFYYISPKIWAWKEHRIKLLWNYVDHLLCILPFEVDYFRSRHNYEVTYVGNPTFDEVQAYKALHHASPKEFIVGNGLSEQPIIALLAGSRKQEIRDNLPRMIEAAFPYCNEYQLVLAAAPGIEGSFYESFLTGTCVHVVRGQTFRLLQHSTAALVTSGTATLETALFGVPQVVCYWLKAGRLMSFLRRLVLKVPYISLVNLIVGREVVPELVADGMTVSSVRRHLHSILPGNPQRTAQLQGYEEMTRILGQTGAPARAAEYIRKAPQPSTKGRRKKAP